MLAVQSIYCVGNSVKSGRTWTKLIRVGKFWAILARKPPWKIQNVWSFGRQGGFMLTRNRSRLRENMQRHVTCLTCIVTWQIVPFLAGTLTLKSPCRGWHGIVPCPNDWQQVSISDNYICSKLFFDVNNPWTTFNAYLHKGIIIIETLTFGHHAVLYAPGLF